MQAVLSHRLQSQATHQPQRIGMLNSLLIKMLASTIQLHSTTPRTHHQPNQPTRQALRTGHKTFTTRTPPHNHPKTTGRSCDSWLFQNPTVCQHYPACHDHPNPPPHPHHQHPRKSPDQCGSYYESEQPCHTITTTRNTPHKGSCTMMLICLMFHPRTTITNHPQ